MGNIESASIRAGRAVLLVDSRGACRANIVVEAQRAGFLTRTLPNEVRARIHLRGEERFAAVIVPEPLTTTTPSAFAKEVRSLRPELPVILVAGDRERADQLGDELLALGLDDDARIRVVRCDEPAALCNAVCELTGTSMKKGSLTGAEQEAA